MENINGFGNLSNETYGEVSENNVINDKLNATLKALEEEYQNALDSLIKKQEKEIEVTEYMLGSIKSKDQNKKNTKKLSENKEKHKKEIEDLKTDFEAKKKKIISDYKHLATNGLSVFYGQDKKHKSERPFLNGDNAYDFFRISEQEIYSLNADKADTIIKEIYDKFKKFYKEIMSDSEIDELIKNEVEKDYELACSYYRKISNIESRIAYKDELDRNEKEKKQEALEKYIKVKCSKADQFDPDLIETRTSNENSILKSVRYKKSIDPVNIFLIDKRNRNILLTKTGEIVFRTAPNNIESYISEYVVSKIINGKEKKYTIYANLNLPELGRDIETGNLLNPEYYDCVANDLLNDGVLRGAKYNKGYVGGVEKNKNGQYHIILANKELDYTEKENLTAVMIYAEQQSNQKKDIEQESDEER